MEEFYLPHPTWNSLKRGTRNLNSYFSNCDSLMGQPDPFDSTLPSVAPPQAGTAPNACIDRDTGAIIELIGRLECISNPNSGCFHATPLSSPPNPNLAPLICADPGFTERAARFSKVGSRSCNGLGGVGIGSSSEAGKIPRVSSCQALKFPGSLSGESKDEIQIPERKLDGISRCATLEKGDPIEESSSVSEQITGRELDVKSAWPNDANPRKRKSIPREKKEICQIQEDGSNHDVYAAKRTKSDESNGTEKSGRNGNGKSMDDSKNNFEPPKDYIHVRARRGQATDSHSLAERVRREKISQRMKFLQDLVPGCNKVTGKAVMLDEIINYVQSLQRQVEFLSMKLSTLNPRTDINMEAILSKDLHQASSLLSQSMIALKSSSASAAFAYGYQSQGLSTNNALSIGSEASFSMSPLNSQRRNYGALFPSIVGFEQSA